ncbi:MAG: hypothetical protein AB4290_26505 [Spirulina sp.]
MREPSPTEQQQYQRLQEIFALARKRYLDAGGDPKRPGGKLNGQDFLSELEKKEIVELGKQIFTLNRVKVSS